MKFNAQVKIAIIAAAKWITFANCALVWKIAKIKGISYQSDLGSTEVKILVIKWLPHPLSKEEKT